MSSATLTPAAVLLAGVRLKHRLAQSAPDLPWKTNPADFAAHLSRGRWLHTPHLDLLSEALLELVEGRDGRLVVLAPPRHGKSEMVSHWFPSWFLERYPTKRVILTSYEADFAATWGRRVRNTLAEYTDQLRVRISEDSHAANRWDTTAGGGMMTAGAGGPITGKGSDLFVIDDPLKNAEEAYSETYRDRVWEWWTSTAYTRLEPGASVVILMTRWHEDDLVGRLLQQMREGGETWRVINLPAVAEPNDQLGRTEGQALWPARYDESALERIRSSTAAGWVWNALYQQRPAPAEGGMFPRDGWRFYTGRPPLFDEVIQSWDMAFTDAKDSSFVVGQVWGRSRASFYLLDQVRARMDFVKTARAVRDLSDTHRLSTTKLVEKKANGDAILSYLAGEVTGLLPINPWGGKEARAAAISPMVAAGNVFLPEPSVTPWVRDFVDEAASFPNSPNDDQVDAMTQALTYWRHQFIAQGAGRDDPRPVRVAGGIQG